MDEIKNFLTTFLIKCIFSTFLPIYATKANWEFINFNLMMCYTYATYSMPRTAFCAGAINVIMCARHI